VTSSSNRCTHRAQLRSGCRASHKGVRRASPRRSAPLAAHRPVHANIVVHPVHAHVVRIRGQRRGRRLRRAHLRLLMKQRFGKRSLREQTVPTGYSCGGQVHAGTARAWPYPSHARWACSVLRSVHAKWEAAG
jgi:hypothetical protein